MSDKLENSDFVNLTAEIVCSYVSNNSITKEQLGDLISVIYSSLQNLEQPEEVNPFSLKPAVPIKKSVTYDYIICLEDGKKFKSLKRHIKSTYGLSPEQYRAKWQLPSDYPMIAPSYSEQRSLLANRFKLGHKR